jgi:hypothetical protein
MIKYSLILTGALVAFIYSTHITEGSLGMYIIMILLSTLVLYCMWNISYYIRYKLFNKKFNAYKCDIDLNSRKINELYADYIKNSEAIIISDVRAVLKQLKYDDKQIQNMITNALKAQEFNTSEALLEYILKGYNTNEQ